MDGQFEFPRQPTGRTVDDVGRLWHDLWKVVERLRLMQDEAAAVKTDAGVSTAAQQDAVQAAPVAQKRLNDSLQVRIAEAENRLASVVATKLPIGKVDGTASSTVKTATVSGITALEDGTACYIVNDGTASASGVTLNVNGLGAKNLYNSMSGAAITTLFAANSGYIFVYNAARNSGNGGWDMFLGYDSNTNTLAYQIRTERTSRPLTDRLSRYLFCFSQPDGTLVPCYTVGSGNGSTGTSKTLNTSRSFDPRMPIFYYASTTNVPNTSQPGGSTLFRAYHACEMRYAWNTGTTLQAVKPCYVRCSPQTDGMCKLDGNDCLVQDLPTTEDGKVYIYLGQAYGSTGYNMELDLEHPCFIYKDGAIKPWSGG